LDDFPSSPWLRYAIHPIDPPDRQRPAVLLRPGHEKNRELKGEELETMVKLHVQFANFHKISCWGCTRTDHDRRRLVRTIFCLRPGSWPSWRRSAAVTSTHFQIELVFTSTRRTDKECGSFHVVQLTLLRVLSATPSTFRRAGAHLPIRQEPAGTRCSGRASSARSLCPRAVQKDKHDEVAGGAVRREQTDARRARGVHHHRAGSPGEQETGSGGCSWTSGT